MQFVSGAIPMAPRWSELEPQGWRCARWVATRTSAKAGRLGGDGRRGVMVVRPERGRGARLW